MTSIEISFVKNCEIAKAREVKRERMRAPAHVPKYFISISRIVGFGFGLRGLFLRPFVVILRLNPESLRYSGPYRRLSGLMRRVPD